MGIKKVLANILGERRYLALLANTFQRLYPTGRVGILYQDVYFLKNLIRNGDCCVDIGAHLGYYTIELSRLVGPEGKVIAVEPMPKFNAVLGQLLRRKGANNVQLLQVALGGEGDFVEMGIPKVGNNKQYAYARVIKSDGQFEYLESVKVKNETGDSLFLALPRVDYIKCDVEGLEIVVFASMMETLKKHRPVLLAELVDKGERIRFFEMLRPLGYQPFLLQEGKLKPLDLASDVFPISHNHYFIPQERMDRLKGFMG
jgi:FkbM family methyltransferase